MSDRFGRPTDTFRDLEKTYPQVERLAQLHQTLGRLRGLGLKPDPDGNLRGLRACADGRSRASVIPFKSKTGRSQPLGSEFVFFMPKWLRWLIKPAPGRALAYIDYSSQEYGTGAALSGDPAMILDYLAGDPYRAMAIRMGYMPHGATPENFPDYDKVRDQFKIVVLAALYSMQAQSLARSLRCSEEVAKTMLMEPTRRTRPIGRGAQRELLKRSPTAA
jgi:hypothetical protein